MVSEPSNHLKGLCCLKVAFLKEAPRKFNTNRGKFGGALPTNNRPLSLRLIQLLDLDIGWGHRLFGFDDQSDLIAGATVRWFFGNGVVGTTCSWVPKR